MVDADLYDGLFFGMQRKHLLPFSLIARLNLPHIDISFLTFFLTSELPYRLEYESHFFSSLLPMIQTPEFLQNCFLCFIPEFSLCDPE